MEKTFPAFPAHAHPKFCVSGKTPIASDHGLVPVPVFRVTCHWCVPVTFLAARACVSHPFEVGTSFAVADDYDYIYPGIKFNYNGPFDEAIRKNSPAEIHKIFLMCIQFYCWSCYTMLSVSRNHCVTNSYVNLYGPFLRNYENMNIEIITPSSNYLVFIPHQAVYHTGSCYCIELPHHLQYRICLRFSIPWMEFYD